METKWSELSRSIGTWAAENFGNTPVARTFRHQVEGPELVTDGVVELDWMAPLMGIVEELGEYAESKELPPTNGPDLAADAVADMGIYFCDYWHRLYRSLCIGPPPYSLDECPGVIQAWDPTPMLVVRRLGRLYQVHLKRFQKIRGMDDTEVYLTALFEAQRALFCAIEGLCETYHHVSFYELTKGVFDEQVAKRNWKKNNKDGSSAASNN